jgi:hypothetical protein
MSDKEHPINRYPMLWGLLTMSVGLLVGFILGAASMTPPDRVPQTQTEDCKHVFGKWGPPTIGGWRDYQTRCCTNCGIIQIGSALYK